MKAILLFVLLSTSLNAQLQNDWDATEILEDMAVSWSVGNGCLEANYKVVNTNGLELNGNTLEVMDATIMIKVNIILIALLYIRMLSVGTVN